MSRPSPELIAEWYAKLPAGSNIETPDGRLKSEQPGGHMVTLRASTDAKPVPVSYEHAHLGAAVWRFPFRRHRPNHGMRGPRGVWVRKQRLVVRLLSEGVPTAEVARRARVSETTVVRLRKAVREWTDPDDGGEA